MSNNGVNILAVSTVSKKGLTTIPRRIRSLLGIEEGDKIKWKVLKDRDKMLIQVEPTKDPYEYLKGKRKDPELTYEKVEFLADSLLLKEIKKHGNR